MHFLAPTPIMRIFDEAKARQFYVDYLGFVVDWEHRFDHTAPPAVEPATPLYMQISRGACKLHLSEHHGDGSPGVYVRIGVDDLEAFHRALHEKQYKYARPGIIDTEWGTREMTIADGFGNKLIFFKETSHKRTRDLA